MKWSKNLAVLAAAATFMSTAATAQVNLNMHTAGSGTPIALTATSLVEQASQRGIANIQLKEGQTATNYIPMLAEGQIDLAGAPFILPFLLTKGRAHLPRSARKKVQNWVPTSNCSILTRWRSSRSMPMTQRGCPDGTISRDVKS